MKTKLIGAALALGLAAMPLASFAGGVGGGNANSNWTIYGWQNWSYELIDVEDYYGSGVGGGDRDIDRISNNAANIGFSAEIDTGVSVAGQAVKATFRCEQFTFHNRFVGSGFFGFNDFCNRNSKIGLAGPWGEFMFANWLLPHNEMVAAWIDPFYDAGADSHTSIMGSVGFGTRFFNGGFGFDNGGGFGGPTNFGPAGGFGSENNAFNRRQNGVVQWFSPNWNGFTARISTTSAQQDPGFNYFAGNGEIRVTSASGAVDELDPRIWSTGIAYEGGVGSAGSSVWGAITYEVHDEWAAIDFNCSDSDDDSWRVAGRYIHDWGNGHSTQIGAMYEEMEYEHDDCVDGDGILGGAAALAGGKTEVEKEAYMISGKHNFPGPLDFRFTYMDADDLDCDTDGVSGVCANGLSDSSSGADAYNVGLFYTMPAGTELRVTYSEISNDTNANYDFGISPAGAAVGGDVDMWAVGIVQWF